MNGRHLESRAQRAELVDYFAHELSSYVGRGAAKLRREGLRAGDFDGDVLVDFADGSTMTLRHAIVVQHESKSIGVFSEHCGDYAFEAVDVRASRVWDGHVFHRYGDLSDAGHSHAGRLVIGGREYIAVPVGAYDQLSRTEPTADAIVFARLSLAGDLRAARRHAGLTRRSLAKRLQKSFKTVCKIELGRYHVSAAYVRRLLAACGLPEDWHRSRPARAKGGTSTP